MNFLPVVLTVVGTLLAVWLGSRLTRSNEARNWRRDRCLEAYTDVLRVCEELVGKAVDLYLLDIDSPDRVAEMRLLTAKMEEMYRLSDRAALLGSYEIQAHLEALCRHCGTKIAAGARAKPKLSEDEWRKVRLDDYAALFVTFRNHARNDLGVNLPLHTSEEWKKILGRSLWARMLRHEKSSPATEKPFTP